MKKPLLLLFLGLLTSFQIIAQCTPISDPTAGLDCQTGTLLCCGEIDGLTGTLPEFVNPTGPVPLCLSTANTTPNNTEWLSFIPGSTGVTLQIIFSNCTETGQGAGAQVGIYSDCTFSENIFCNDLQNLGEVIVPLNNLVIGQRHYLFLDGWNGSICDYVINVVNGTLFAPENPQSPAMISGPTTACTLSQSNYFAGFGLASGYNIWEVTPQDIVFIDNGTAIEVLDWGSSAGGTAEICVTGGNECYGDAPTQTCIAVNIEENPEVIASGEYYFCEDGYLFDQNNQVYFEGVHTVLIPNITPTIDCDTIYTLTVEKISEPLEIIINASSTACENDGFIEVAAVNGGIPPYSYQWSHGPTTPMVTDLYEGLYFVEVVDDSGCSIMDSVVIASSLTFDLNTSFADCDVADGSAEITAANIDDLNVAWSTGATGPLLENLAEGGYSVTVTNQITSCIDHEVFVIEEDSSCYATISGYVISEDELDCAAPELIFPVGGVMVNLSDGQTVFTTNDGYYEFRVDPGNYTVTLGTLPTGFISPCFNEIMVDAPDFFGVYADNNFNLEYELLPDIQLKVWKQNARPGFDQSIRVCVMNVGPIPVTTTITCEHPDLMTFMQADPMESSYDLSNYLITWEDVTVQPGVIEFLYVDFNIPVGTALGTPISYTFRTDDNLIGVDATPDNNVLVCNREITGSYDPNDKQVDPIGEGVERYLPIGTEQLSYQIRFQNSGTDTAFTVLLRDTLSEHLEVNSIRLGPSSHNYTAALRAGNILEILYDNILLPDSFVNEPASNGFFLFDVNLKPDLAPGTPITNRAGIYFDYNSPIITNTVLSTIPLPTNTTELNQSEYFELYPNPTTGNLTLTSKNSGQAIDRLEIVNINGQLIQVISTDWDKFSNKITLPLAEDRLDPGVYLLKVTLIDGRQETLKFIYM